MTARRSNDFVVGIAVILGVIAIVAGTLWVQQADLGARRSGVMARFRDVGNAQVGNTVVVRGVPSGRLEAMELEPGGWVSVRMRIDEGIQLPPDPVVVLGQASLFGEWQATIMERAALPADRELRRQIEEAGGPGVLPGAALPDIAQLTAVAGRIAGDVASVADRVQVAFDDSAARELRSSIHDFSEMSAALAQTVRRQSANLDAITREVAVGARALSGAAGTVERVAQRVDSSTARGEVGTIVSDAGAAATELRAAANELRTLSTRLAGSQARLDSLLTHTNSVVAKLDNGHGTLGLLISSPSLYQQSDTLVQQLRALVEDFRANPRRYVNLRIF